ncbi:M23 family metallopeptidase [Paenibacillus alkaliterrae]|uniref:M23 family metallopeptidase n=1 Tax=Paenibacillus alkaliterrae TaxID=320909 RepID=UPI001F2E2000|nr:M23 family metallopeptidase [Paenibacillus alkaliterrae]MCF2937698.1 M23 family metallopeptidase [Paenibacillus alkaliterrae]
MNLRMKKLVCGTALAALLTVSPGIGSAASYTVQKNDTLWLISTKQGTTVEQLKKLNGFTSDYITAGQKLIVPAPPEFTSVSVLPGDTMWIISQRHGVPLAKLIAANPQLTNPNNIWTGLEIRVPKKPSAYLNGVFPLAKGTYTPFSNNYAEARSWSADGSAVRAHEGVDMFADKGTPVYSAMAGTVVKAGWNEYGGWRVTVRVDESTEFYYAHLSKYAAGVKVGATVTTGQLIGYAGSTGYGPEGTEGKFLPHLHFGIYKRTPTYHAIDPYLYMKWWSL